MKTKAKLAKGRFTGDPSYEFEHVDIKKSGEGDEAVEEEESVSAAVIYVPDILCNILYCKAVRYTNIAHEHIVQFNTSKCKLVFIIVKNFVNNVHV